MGKMSDLIRLSEFEKAMKRVADKEANANTERLREKAKKFALEYGFSLEDVTMALAIIEYEKISRGETK